MPVTDIFWLSYVVLWCLVIRMAVLLLLVYRHFGLMALGTADGVQRDGLAVGDHAPTFAGITASEENKQWPDGRRAGLLLFAAPGCEPCARVLPFVQSLHELAP